jgi:PLP dependent protein
MPALSDPSTGSATSRETNSLATAHGAVRERIATAARRSGRDPRDVSLVAVSKTVPAERLRSAIAAGIDVFGENRVQEAADKIAAVPGASWHLVGHLQSNKARRAVELFSAIESVDSVELARRLDELVAAVGHGRRLAVYLQVNVDEDPAKSGFVGRELERAIDGLASLEHVELVGLMTVGRLVADPEEARPTFVRLRELSVRLRERESRMGPGLSMGMTDDFEVAVEEGATVVRIGRAIFGERPAD